MNILLINHYAGSTHHGMEYRPFYMARQWISMGHQVTIVAGSRSHVRMKQPAEVGSVTEECVEGVRYVWLKTPAYSGNGVRRVLNIFAFVVRLWWHYKRIVGAFPPDAIIASSTYPLDIFPARKIARKYMARLLFEVHDLWPLTPIQIGGMSPWHPFIMLLQYAENYAYRHSDRVISMLPTAFEYMRQHGLSQAKFIYIPNGIKLSDWQRAKGAIPEPHVSALATLRQEGRFIVGYLGGHQQSNALCTILDAAERLQDRPVTFVLVGHGAEKEYLQQNAAERKLANVVFLPPVAKSCIPDVLAAMDVLYLGLKNRPIFQYGISPNKLMDYMMSGKPVIHAVDAGNDLVAESGCGISCHGEDPAGVAAAVIRMMELPAERRAAMGRCGKDYILRHHQYCDLAKRFIDAMA